MTDHDDYDDHLDRECVAARYGDRALCGCDNCREYTAEQDSYEV